MVKNRTTNLMYPFYSTFGNEFINIYNSISNKYNNIALYLADYEYNNYNNFKDYDKFLDDDLIFVQVLEETMTFDRGLLVMQSHQNYVTDYESNGCRVIVFKLNEPYSKALRKLKMSEYSKMYKKEFVDSYYEESKFWYLKYKDELTNVSFNVFTNGKVTTMEQHKEKWDRVDARDFFDGLMLSPYHVLNKSETLKEILEYVYNAEFPKENELIEKIKLEKEILNYDKSKSNKDVQWHGSCEKS